MPAIPAVIPSACAVAHAAATVAAHAHATSTQPRASLALDTPAPLSLIAPGRRHPNDGAVALIEAQLYLNDHQKVEYK
jgi:hypothetical protein